jgi:hypothetical protein
MHSWTYEGGRSPTKGRESGGNVPNRDLQKVPSPVQDNDDHDYALQAAGGKLLNTKAARSSLLQSLSDLPSFMEKIKVRTCSFIMKAGLYITRACGVCAAFSPPLSCVH